MLRRNKPAWVKAEVSPNHLFLNTSEYARQGARVQMNPPIRSPEDNAALWAGLRDGILDFIGTDHAPHTLEEKRRPYPRIAVRHARCRNRAAADAHRDGGRQMHAG